MSELGKDLLLLILLIVGYGFFAMGETVLSAWKDKKLEKQPQSQLSAKKLKKMLDQYDSFLFAAQGCRILLVLSTGALAIHGFQPLLISGLRRLGLDWDSQWMGILSFLVVLLCLFFFLALTRRLMAKKKAGRSETLAYKIAVPLYCLLSLVRWLTNFIALCAKSLSNHGHTGQASDKEDFVTQEDIRLMMDAGEETGAILSSEKAMIDNVFAFGDRTAGEIMTHRTDIVAIEADATLEEILKVVAQEGYSRIPVYVESLDNIIGILHVKDLFPYVQGQKPFELKAILHRPYVAPESKKADELFRELKRTKKYIAILIDEYGGTAGLVTMEDLMESIVGNIFDEYDQEETEPIQQLGGDLLLDGSVSWEEALSALKLEPEEEDEEYETVSGFLLAQLSRIPEPNEHPQVIYRGWRFWVKEMVGRRIAQIVASPLPASSEEQTEKGKNEKGKNKEPKE